MKYTMQDLREFCLRADSLEKINAAAAFLRRCFKTTEGNRNYEELIEILAAKRDDIKWKQENPDESGKLVKLIEERIKFIEKSAAQLLFQIDINPEDYQYYYGKLEGLRELRDELKK